MLIQHCQEEQKKAAWKAKSEAFTPVHINGYRSYAHQPHSLWPIS